MKIPLPLFTPLLTPLSRPGLMALLLALLWAAPGLTKPPAKAGPKPLPAAYTAKVVEVIDGDTLVTDTAETIRLVNINAPEIFHDGRPPQPGALAAKTALRELVLGQTIKVQPGPQKRDKYKRTLAWVYQGNDLVQAKLLRAGLVHVYSFPENALNLGPLVAAEAQARQQRLGLWALPRWQVRAATAEFDPAWVGQFHLVTGQVRQVTARKEVVYLNFGDDWRTDFSVEIRDDDWPYFQAAGVDPKTFYRGKTVLVRGVLKPVNGTLVTASHPGQLMVVGR